MDLTKVKAIVLDIEGTICPISFVKDTLFPYALEALPKLLSEKWDDPEFKKYREDFPDEAKVSPEAFQAHVQDITKKDIKVAYLKNLQGHLFRTGYETSAFSTPLFPDVIPALKTWSAHKDLAIFSSGSVDAQKLFLAYVAEDVVTDGASTKPAPGSKTVDLNGLFDGRLFDTVNAGSKVERESYVKIAKALKRKEEEVLFLSDNVNEVRAALHAGLDAAVVNRPGNAPLSMEDENDLLVIESLDEIKHIAELEGAEL
ncbi:2,3-diketo-5-methylthio-1-phosphopentane phosphatase [Patellaria atrata CBS 101060]|uniref:2,3-diketo-5-methylthio-1-phosphopentane phosphatase n=1 Tax=Patellaria atrata CBS 101060 TaxID=1346257 RepID=A0A9P4VMQ9_9PEZI|nr:2,3-diketo-5-methylthio-1-phosphopentane phosphatase [Patellaria atrata CBS 101060]